MVMNSPETFEAADVCLGDYADLRKGFHIDSSGPDDFATLRRYMDGDDQFMRGHQILKERRLQRDYPEWMVERLSNDAFLSDFLAWRFPRLNTCPRQRRTVGRWAVIIRQYMLAGQSCAAVAEILNWGKQPHERISKAYVRRTAQMVRQAFRGVRLDSKERSFGQAGRPKKSPCTPETTVIGTSPDVASTT
jgi:hypothetical protein